MKFALAFAGLSGALGVALGSLATVLGLMFTKVIDLGWWSPFAVIGIIFAISLPSMLIAWRAGRTRHLSLVRYLPIWQWKPSMTILSRPSIRLHSPPGLCRCD